MKIKIKKKVQNSAPSLETCRECEGCELLGRPKALPFGRVDVQPVMIIKDSMDLDEDRANPFNSEGGRRLKKYLIDSGIGTDVRVIYSIKCKPMGIEPPSPACYKKCVSFVAKEIEQFNPKFVLILGSGIVKPLLKVGFKRNKNCIVEKDGIQYMILDSLGSTVRKPSAQKLMEQNFERFKRLIEGKLENGSSFNYTTVYTPEQFKQCLADLEAEKTCISYDIETTGLKMYRPDVYLGTIGFGVEEKEWVVPFNHPDSPFTGQFRLQRQMYKLLLNVMKKAHKKNGAALVAHNGKFDNKGLYYKFGEAPMMDDDTMLMSYNLDENEPNDLKNLSKIYCNANDYAIDATDILKFPLEVVAKYNAYDVHYTRRLWSIFKKKLAEDPITQKIYDHITFPASYSYQLAEIEGVPIDVEKLDEAIEENHDTVQGYLRELNRLYPQVLNWNSAQQVGKLFFEDLKMPILEKTKKGAPSISGESVLPRLIEYDPVIQVLLDYKKHLKLGQFLNGWKDELFEGKLFPSFLIHGTVTGRPSCVSEGTEVMVPGGTKLIEDIDVGDDVYCYDDNLKLVIRKVTWWGYQGEKKCYRVNYISQGNREILHLDVTGDHRIRLTSGEYIRVDKLHGSKVGKGRGKHRKDNVAYSGGEHVLALHRSLRDGNRNMLSITGIKRRQRENRIIFEQYHGYLPEHVHHLDENPSNDSPDNLVGKTSSAHAKLHVYEHLVSKVPGEMARRAELGHEARRRNKARRLANNHMITTIEEIPGKLPVYDISVEGEENFIANEICVHNCKAPNLQQVPRDGSVRSLINITDPEWVILEADYSQAELRIAAVMSEDPVMKMCFQTGIDVHLRTAAAVSGVSLEEVTKDMRKKAKGINFGYVYGMGAKKFQEYARDKYGVDMTMGQAVEARRAFFSLYNHLTPWHERQRALVHKYGYVRSIIGRKRRLPDIYSDHKGTMLEAERQSINSPVQGFGSDLDVISLNRITREVDRNNCRPFGTVHDAILMRVRRSALAEVVPQVAHIMSDTKAVEKIFKCKPITVPIDTEIEVGAWGKGTTVYEEGKVLDEVIDKIMAE